MDKEQGHGWRLMEATGQVCDGPARLIRAILFAAHDGGDCTLYEGTGTDGRKITQWRSVANHPHALEFDIRCENGIHYVEGTAVNSCLVIFDPIVEEETD